MLKAGHLSILLSVLMFCDFLVRNLDLRRFAREILSSKLKEWKFWDLVKLDLETHDFSQIPSKVSS